MNTSDIDLFSNIICDRCGLNPGFDPKNPSLWFGVEDQDTGQKVCIPCKPRHYELKKVELNLTTGMLYSEFPVLLNFRRI
jgi:hypothetical protein